MTIRSGKRIGVERSAGFTAAVTVRGARIVSAGFDDGSAAPGALRLRAGRFSAPVVHLAVCDPDHVHRTLTLPPMTAAERSDVVRREIARDGDEPKAVGWHLLRRTEVDGLPQDELLVVTAPSAQLDETLEPLAADGIVPRAVVTGAVALVAAAHALAPAPLEHPAALVHWGGATLTIAVISGGALRFARVIEALAVDLDPMDWIPIEIDRSIRHYLVVSQGERVEEVLLSVASAAGATRLFAGGDLSDRLRLPVTNMNALLRPRLPGVAPGDRAAGVFTLAYGAACLGAGDAPNLVSPEVVFQQRSRRVITTAVAAGVLVALTLGGLTLTLMQRERDLRGRLTRAQAALEGERMSAEEAERIDMERQRMAALPRLLTEDPLRLVPPGDALREIARLTPGPLRLELLSLATDDRGYVISLTGRIEQEDFTRAQEDLNEFFYGLRASPLFHGVEIRQTSRIEPTVDAAAEGTTPVVALASSRPLAFVIAVRLQRLG